MQSSFALRKPDTNLSMGMELECYFLTSNSIKIKQHYGFWYAVKDLSINPPSLENCSVEFVSQPLPKEWLKKEIKKLNKRVGDWEFNSSCGIHIHLSRKWMNEGRAHLIQEFYSSLSNEDRLAFFGRESNEYCVPGVLSRTNRYKAVNICNKNTIEFRMFSSGDVKWAQYCVDCADYMVRNARHLNIEAFYAFRDSYC